MTKFIKLGVLAVICTAILTGYSSAQSKTTTSAVTIDPTLTPENSCVIFFLMRDLNTDFIQIDPAFPHSKEEIKFPKFYSTPLIPGSTYICEEMHIGDTVWAGYPCIEDTMPIGYLNYSEKGRFKGYKLRVPKEPCFYYCYVKTMHGENGNSSWEIVVSKTADKDFSKSATKAFKEHIKTCAKFYAGTAWESVINEQVEVWTK